MQADEFSAEVALPAPVAPVQAADALPVLVRELAVPEAVGVARAAVRRLAERERASASVRDGVALAVTEACTNVVLHAYDGAQAPGLLEVRAGRADDALLVEVHDDGRGMVPRIDSPGLGFGLALIGQMADVFEICTRRRAGLVVRMRFELSGASES